MAPWIPLRVGTWSDRLRTPIGGRLPFLLAGGLPAAVGLALIGFLDTLAAVAIASALLRFLLRGLRTLPRAVSRPVRRCGGCRRAQSAQALARGVGTGVALVGGGLLLSIARPLPLVVAGLMLVVAIFAFVLLLARTGLPDQPDDPAIARDLARRLARLIATNSALRCYLIAMRCARWPRCAQGI